MSTLTTTTIKDASANSVAVVGLAKIGNAGENVCSAWVTFIGTDTPPTIIDSYNVTSVDRTAVGYYTLNFGTAMDNINYSVVGSGRAILDSVAALPKWWQSNM